MRFLPQDGMHTADRRRAAEIAKEYAADHRGRRRDIPGENKHDK
ncbi:MAG: hypothetical protein ACI89X_002349 [Planctomycetota bacterium]|jgi:hypothetical protein